MKKLPKFLMKLAINLLLLLSLLNLSFARVNAVLARPEIADNETVMLQIETDQNGASIENLEALSQDFSVMNSQQSSSSTLINSSLTHTIKWQFELLPNKTGDLSIPSLKVGKENTQVLSLKVSKNNSSQANLPDDEIFIEVELVNAEDNKVYPQQNFYIMAKLWLSIDLLDGQISELNADGLIVSKIKESENRTFRNNKTYAVFTRIYTAYAEKSGEIKVPPIKFQGAAYSQNNLGTGRRIVRAQSPELNISVQAFDANQQARLLASEMELTETWSPPPYKVGEPIYRTIELRAKDILKDQMPVIKLPDIKTAKVYEDSSSEAESNFDSKNIVTSKKYRFVVLPSQAGELKVDEFKLPWFDTKNKQLSNAVLTPTILMIDADPAANTAADIDKKSPANLANQELNNSANLFGRSANQELNTENISFWKMITIALAILNIITIASFAYFWLKYRPNKRLFKSAAQANSEAQFNMQNVQTLLTQAQSLEQIQKLILNYWNGQFDAYQVNNLSEIMSHVKDQYALKILTTLQTHLYQQRQEQNVLKDTNWKEVLLVLKPDVKEVNNLRLPNLYD